MDDFTKYIERLERQTGTTEYILFLYKLRDTTIEITKQVEEVKKLIASLPKPANPTPPKPTVPADPTPPKPPLPADPTPPKPPVPAAQTVSKRK